MSLRTITCFLIYILFCVSCAKQGSPTGGPKDSIPPVLVRSYPLQKQLNFKDKQIDLTFSEIIALNNPREQIIITPTIGKDYKVKAKKKSVTIEFDNAFADSTTYTINFRESIQDITEKNAAVNLKLAFSTGPYIDSLSVQGKVYDILTGKELKEITIALSPKTDTFNIFKHKPNYIAKTNDKGQFRMENIKAGSYFIYALDDKNNNLVVDSKTESYGYLSQAIKINENIKNISIPTLRLDSRTLKLTSARSYSNYFNIKTTKNLIAYKIKADTLITSSFGEDQSNIKIYNTFNSLDSVKIHLIGYDSIYNKLDTTLYAKFIKRKGDLEKFKMTISEPKVEANKGILRFDLDYNKPLYIANYDSIFYTIDSLNVIRFTSADFAWDSVNTKASFEKTIDKKLLVKKDETKTKSKAKVSSKVENTLTIGKGFLISIDRDSSSRIEEKVKILREEDTAVLMVKVKTTEPNFIVELIDKNNKIIHSIKNTNDYKIENLLPTSYFLKLIIDKNNNGKWDAGNYFKNEEPETITFYKSEKGDKGIYLKANWEVGPLLITF